MIHSLLKGLKDNPKESLSTIGRKAYNESLAPGHSFMLRSAVRLIFFTVPGREHFIQKTFGDLDHKAFSSLVGQVVDLLEPLVAYLRKYYKDRSLTNLE